MTHNAKNIKLQIAYDGTDFCGWQKQNNSRTVQQEIEKALITMHGTSVNLTGSGRTDTGVHAQGQCANFYTNMESIPAERFAPALNKLLPHDVRIMESCEVPNDFHSRYSAVSRTYRYHFICKSTYWTPVLPTESRYNLPLYRFPCIETLNAYGRLLLGEIDCSFFASAKDSAILKGKSTNRYIYKALFYTEGNRLIFEICANAFLRKMVRSIAGTFLHYEEKNTSPEKLLEIISSGNRTLAGTTLPPQGLFLWKVEY